MTQEYAFPEEESGPSLDIGRILSAAKRRFLFFLIPFVLILIGSVTVILILPPKYESSGTILVETQQIPTELVQSTVTSDPNQRITILKQRVMTRQNLLNIIDKYNVFGKDRQLLPVSKLVQQMQNQISIDVITSDVGGSRRGTTTIAFTVAFEHKSPQIAADVANELVTLFLSENVRTRTERASETTAFLNNETQKLRDQLTEIENKIVAYKQEHGDALPEHLDLRQKMLERTETEERDLARDIQSLEEEKRYLQIELTSARSGRTTSSGAPAESELQKNIETLKKSLLDASTRLTDNHPTIIALKKRIAALEKEQAAEDAKAADAEASGKPETGSTYNPLVEKLQIRIDATNKKIAASRQQMEAAKKKVAELEAIILEIPQVERGLSVLNRNYQEVLEKFNSLEAKQAQAQLSQNLEEGKKAERFVLLEPPIVPSDPVSPNRVKILGFGGFLAFAAGVGFAVLIELIDRRIRSSSELEAVLKHPPIVSIPYIHTPRETDKNRYRLLIYAGIAIVILIVLLAAVHFLYQPLDTLFYRAWVAIDKLKASLF
ncbi:MAG: lipopolysaccharide biosynthesis protein [Alphaproteobacteria bacterium]|nr:MAG: lipopolysaccharide biosynthesis protein [Alphaproteobacteria bacterium]